MSDDLYMDAHLLSDATDGKHGSHFYKKDNKSYLNPVHEMYLNDLCKDLHAASYNAGWWHNQKTGEELIDNEYVLGTKISLLHSELSEALEGLRTDAMDKKLPQYPEDAVEMADVVIRVFDYAGARGYNLGTIIAEKQRFNAERADHKIENRVKAGGKKF